MTLVERKRRVLTPFLPVLAIFAVGIFTGCGSGDDHAAPDAGGDTEAGHIAPKFTATKGNDRAHIDSVRATVYYTNRCD